MTTQIITLATTLPTATTLCESVVTADGQTVLSHTTAPLPLLPLQAGTETVVMVPAARLSWHQVSLPKGSLGKGFLRHSPPQKLRAVLDGLLEDRVLDDPTQLHFALAPQADAARHGAPVWVAACDRAWLHAWLAALEQTGRSATRLVPEMVPTPDSVPPVLYVVGTPDDARVVRCDGSGVLALPLAAAPVALLSSESSAAQVLAEPAVAALAEQQLPGRVSLHTRHQRVLVAAQSPWDLAQFDLLRTRRARATRLLREGVDALLQAPRWRAARWAALALVGINLVGLQAWAWKEQAGQAAKRAAIRATLTQTFPEVRVVVDAPLQMARALADLQRGSGVPSGTDLDTMLSQFQAVALEKYSPSAIEFVAGQLRLQDWGRAGAPAPSPADLPGLNARLQAQGLRARLEGERLILTQERQP